PPCAERRVQRLGSAGNTARPALPAPVERGRAERAIGPAGTAELRARTFHVEIGNRHKLHARRGPHLREEHGAELAGADQADRHRPAGSLPRQQHGMKIHDQRPKKSLSATYSTTMIAATP